ncbi:hypothetical protein [Ornithobacterium rhinotracheale]|uniref:hypothetical protein n=1 Tax=Ornithobacterium rhinotracheale TaxID=28251 RepID=UPI001FF25DFB|nr:hypothetical protein [Ornithobacterium rhinotracheale]MCK0204222.1 hypothetical protein [Ornithobacterium rhinotracheale]
MKTKFLIPRNFKWLGLALVLIGIALWTYSTFKPNFGIETKVFAFWGYFEEDKIFDFSSRDILYTLVNVLWIVGGLMIAFAREKVEDEFIEKLRLESFQWAFLVNYLILLVLFIFVYGFAFINVLIFSIYTVLILFILRFHYLLFKQKKG